jgi:hypothetical protein
MDAHQVIRLWRHGVALRLGADPSTRRLLHRPEKAFKSASTIHFRPLWISFQILRIASMSIGLAQISVQVLLFTILDLGI